MKNINLKNFFCYTTAFKDQSNCYSTNYVDTDALKLNKISHHLYYNNQLPISMNPSDYGIIEEIKTNEDNSTTYSIKINNKCKVYLTQCSDKNCSFAPHDDHNIVEYYKKNKKNLNGTIYV